MVGQQEGQLGSGENVVYIGKKPTMNYVLAVVTQFNNNNSQVTIKARGKSIGRAVDVAEVARKRFLNGVAIGSIRLGSEELANEDGTRSKVSSIHITLGRGAQAGGPDIPENVVYVGKKPTMSYVFAVVTQFNSNASRVAIKARGNSIQKAVDAAEIVRNRFVPGARVEGVAIGSEELANEDGTKSNVSSIHIVLGK